MPNAKYTITVRVNKDKIMIVTESSVSLSYIHAFKRFQSVVLVMRFGASQPHQSTDCDSTIILWQPVKFSANPETDTPQ